MRVRFTADYDFIASPAITIAYKVGMELTVKRACGEAAIAANKAVELPASPRTPSLKVENDGDQ